MKYCRHLKFLTHIQVFTASKCIYIIFFESHHITMRSVETRKLRFILDHLPCYRVGAWQGSFMLHHFALGWTGGVSFDLIFLDPRWSHRNRLLRRILAPVLAITKALLVFGKSHNPFGTCCRDSPGHETRGHWGWRGTRWSGSSAGWVDGLLVDLKGVWTSEAGWDLSPRKHFSALVNFL